MAQIEIEGSVSQFGEQLWPPQDNVGDPVIWTGDGDGVSFEDPDNWDSDVVPTEDDVAIFNSTSGDPSVTMSGARYLQGISMEDGFEGNLVLQSGVDLNVGWGGIAVYGGVLYGALSGSINCAADIDVKHSGSFVPGGLTLNTNTSQSDMYTQQQERKYYGLIALDENEDGFLTYYYTHKFTFDTAKVALDGSFCQVEIVDRDLINPEEYSIYGFNFDGVTHLRHFFAIAEWDWDENPPAEGEEYKGGRLILFSGFNKVGWEIETGMADLFTATYHGIELLGDEILISGGLVYTMEGLQQNSEVLDDMSWIQHKPFRCVFNKGGFPNKLKGISVLPPTKPRNKKDYLQEYDEGIMLFDNSKVRDTEFWTLRDIFVYVVRWLLRDDAHIINNIINPHGDQNDIGIDTTMERLPYLTRFLVLLIWNESPVLEEMEKIIVNDFELENVGIYSALVMIFKNLKKYALAISYDTDAKVRLLVKPKANPLRDNNDIALYVARGDLGETLDVKKLFEDTTLHFTRDCGRVGRVIVKGARLKILTFATSLKKEEETGLFEPDLFFSRYSVGGRDYVEPIPGYSKDFSNNMAFSMRKQQDNTYFMDLSNLRCIDSLVPLTQEQLNEVEGGDNLKMFKSIAAPKLLDFIPSETDSDSDIGIYAPGYRIDGEDIYPYHIHLGAVEIDNRKYMNIDHIRREEPLFSLTLYENGVQLDSAKPPNDVIGANADFLGSYIANTIADYKPYEDTAFDHVDKSVLLFAKCLIETDYRIKGIAQIEDFDEEKHETITILDEDRELYLRYLDSSYYDGYFNPEEDGFIPGHEKSNINILERIQEEAEAILFKYQTLQNSGMLPLKGIQSMPQMGDYIKKIYGGERSVNYPTMIQTVEYNFRLQRTNLGTGAVI